MVTAKQVYEEPLKQVTHEKLLAYMPALKNVDQGAFEGDVLNVNGCMYYQWLPQLVKWLNPKQVVELGGAMGLSAIMMLQELDENAMLYTITLEEHGLEYCWLPENYNNLTKIVGDDLDMANWKGVDLSKTDLWFFDTEHSEDQLRKELKLYEPFFRKGAVVLLDDIHLNSGMDNVWEELIKRYDHCDGTDPLHYSGFGIIVV